MKIELKGKDIGQACLEYANRNYELDSNYYYDVKLNALTDISTMLNAEQFKAEFTVTIEQGRKRT